MKKSILFLFISISILSCKKDSQVSGSATIIGKWKITNIHYLSKTLTGSVVQDQQYSNFTTKESREFKSDGTFIAYDDDDLSSGNYTFDKNTNKLFLTFKVGYGDDNLTVTSLTSSSLEFNFKNPNNGGYNELIEYKATKQ